MADQSLDEELQERIEEEERRKQAFAAHQQQERMQRQSNNASQVQNVRSTIQKVQKWSKWAKWLMWTGELLVATFPIWGPLLLVLFIAGSFIGGCNASTTFRIASLGACDPFIVGAGGTGGGAGGGASFSVDIILTSAYRPGPTSTADSRGETVDIALRNPIDPIGSTDPRISQVVQLAQAAGFTAPAGYIQNEYANPSPGATGGHIHVQFNLKPDGTTYCDGTKVSNPPADLVNIPASIPMSGVSNARLRPCMLSAVEAIFNSAK